MNTFEKHFLDFPAFLEEVMSWEPDFLVPVAKKGCKLIKTIENVPQLCSNPELIKYRSFFELTNPSVKDKKVAVLDDATQYTATLQEYRRYFENHGAIVKTYSFVGHEDLVTGKRWKEDPLAEIKKPLPEPVYQEYILQQSYHLLKSGNHFDLDHLIFEIKLPHDRVEYLLEKMKTYGELLFVEDYFLHEGIIRFSLNQPLFFHRIPYLETPSISLGAIRKIKLAYEKKNHSLCFSPLVFPTWDFSQQSVGSTLFHGVPFKLPYKVPDLLDKKNKDALLRVYYNIYFTCVVSLAKAFVQTILKKDGFDQTIEIKRNDLDAVLGVCVADDFVSSVKSFISGSNVFDFTGSTRRLNRLKKPRYNDFASVLDKLKMEYENKVQKKKTRVGVHYYICYDTLFREFRDITALSSDLDYYCDFGVIVPEVVQLHRRLLRGCRAGEPNSEYNWKRTQILIPIAIYQFCSEIKSRVSEVGPTILNKILANFIFDYPSEEYHELHCLIGEPYTYGTLVGVYHRHRASSKPNIYAAERISPYYEWNGKKGKFRAKDRSQMIKEIPNVFDDRQEIPYTEILTYFKLLSKVYSWFKKVDILNMLSICREENYFYAHVIYNIRTSLEDFGVYIDSNDEQVKLKYLKSSIENAQSALEKLELAGQVDEVIAKIQKRFGRDVEFVTAVETLKKHHSTFSSSFRMTLQQIRDVVTLELILTNLCLLIMTQNTSYADELTRLKISSVLKKNGVSFPQSLVSFLRQTNQEQQQLINCVYDAVIVKHDSIPRIEQPMLSARLCHIARQHAKNTATSYVHKMQLPQACLVCIDFSRLRYVPEPKENLLSRYYQMIEHNILQRGGKKLYGGSGGDDMFAALFTDITPAIQCAKDIKRDFAEDLFLRSKNHDVKFGLSLLIFQDDNKEEQIAQLWMNAKDCCEFKGRTFRNRGDLLISKEVINILQSRQDCDLKDKFIPIKDAYLQNGSQLFRFTEIQTLTVPKDTAADENSMAGTFQENSKENPDLSNKLTDASEDRKSKKKPKKQKGAIPNSVDVAIITVLDIEYKAVLDELDLHFRYSGTTRKPNNYGWEYGEIKHPGSDRCYAIMVALVGRKGSFSAQHVTLRTVESWKPRYVILTGIAGGFKRKNLNLGDVVVSDYIVGYEYGELGKIFKPRSDLNYPVDDPLVRAAISLSIKSPEWAQRITQYAPEKNISPKMVHGLVASGDKVVEEPSNEFFAQVINTWDRIQAVEMEGTGAAFSIQKLREEDINVGLAMIRGISDMPPVGENEQRINSDTKQASERKTWKSFASLSAACFTVKLIREFWPIPPKLRN